MEFTVFPQKYVQGSNLKRKKKGNDYSEIPSLSVMQ